MTPQIFCCGVAGVSTVNWQSSMACAPLFGSTSASWSPVSQGVGGSYFPLQSLSTLLGSPATSTAPGFTLGSQSLQSPWAGVQPSPSMSASMFVTSQALPEPVLVADDAPDPTPEAKLTPPAPWLLDMVPPFPAVGPLPMPPAPDPEELVNVWPPVAEHAAVSAQSPTIRPRLGWMLRNMLLSVTARGGRGRRATEKKVR